MRVLPIWLLLLILLLAGCAGDKPSAKAAVASTTAAPPTVNESTGSITGVVVDDEQLPLAGVTVGATTLAAPTETDKDGRFTINDLAPQTYTVAFQRLGYESSARRVDVVAGEIIHVNMTLKAILVGQDPYVVAIPKTALIHADNVWIGFYQRLYANHSSVSDLRCSPCEFTLHIEKGPVALMTEAFWTGSYAAAVNQEVTVYYYHKWTPTTFGTLAFGGAYMGNRDAVTWTEAQTKAIEKSDLLRMHVFGGGVPAVGGAHGNVINHEHRVNTWTSLAYGAPFAEGYTAMPPA